MSEVSLTGNLMISMHFIRLLLLFSSFKKYKRIAKECNSR